MVVRVPVRGYYNEISYFYIDEGTNHGFLIDPGSQADRLLSIVPLDADPAFALDVIYAPGHTTDSVVYYSPKDRVACVGDTIFKGSIGIWDCPGGNLADLQRSILEKIFTRPEDTALYSGHSVPTTGGEEKRRYGL